MRPSVENDRYGFLSSDGYPEEGPNPLIKPPPSAEKDARARIAEAAALTGSPWLDYMARHAEPNVTPDAWADAVIRADREIALYADRCVLPPGGRSDG